MLKVEEPHRLADPHPGNDSPAVISDTEYLKIYAHELSSAALPLGYFGTQCPHRQTHSNGTLRPHMQRGR